MYFVDKNKIEQNLQYMERLLEELQNQSFDTYVERLSLERITHMVIESMLDVGNMLIDGFIMRDPGSFDDIIDILIDEQVLPEQETEAYKEIIGLRKMLVKDYLTINHQILLDTLSQYSKSIDTFSERVRNYVSGEQNVATTFSNQ